MGNSIIHFFKKSFEVNDGVMEVILILIVAEIEKEPSPASWLSELKENWKTVATEEFGFGSIPELEAFLETVERRKTITQFAQKGLEKLKSFDDPIPVEVLNGIKSGKENSLFLRELPQKIFIDAFEDFIHLLES